MNIADQWKSWTPLHKTLILASAGLAVTAAVLGYGAFRSHSAAREATSRMEQTVSQVQTLERENAKSAPMPDLSAIGRAIPNEWEMARFFADLAVAAKTRHVTVVSVTPAQPPEDRGAYSPPASRPGTAPSSSRGTQAAPAGGNAAPAPAPAGTPAQNNGSSGTGGSGGTGGNSPGNGTSKSRGSTPPPSIPGLYTLELTLNAEGSGPDLLAFLDELQAMPRFVWINEYNLDFAQQNRSDNPAAARLDVKLTLYSHAPWDAKAANEIPWPFPIEPAGNPEAFGAP